jgi:uncharacterized protein
LKTIILFIILEFVLCNIGCCQPPNRVTQKNIDSFNTTSKENVIDSLKYIPEPVGYTNDFVKLFTQKEVESLDSLIIDYKKKTTVQFAIATINSSFMGPIEFESYTLRMLRTWGVGTKEKNNGILIVIAPDIRRIRIENGYGIEKILTNQETKEIIDSVFIPYFRESKFFTATKEGILAIIKKLKENGL